MQHDGFKGLAANSLRYSFHSLEIGFVTDGILIPALNIPSLSQTLNQIYIDAVEPVFHEAGSERGAFQHVTLSHEDYSWFGVFGAIIFFFCLPTAILRNPKCLLYLVPAIFYFLIVAGSISWMIWNGRFMSVFFLALTPALAITLNIFDNKRILQALAALALCALFTVKITDFNRPILALGEMVAKGIELTPKRIIKYSFSDDKNVWSKINDKNSRSPGNPLELLVTVPQGAEVAIIGFGHLGHFNFYKTRSDLIWRPLNGSILDGKLDTNAALGKFIESDIKYCVIVGPMPDGVSRSLAKHCANDYGHLIIKRPQSDSP